MQDKVESAILYLVSLREKYEDEEIEVLVCENIDCSYLKGGEISKVKLRMVKMDINYKMCLLDLKKQMNNKTVGVVVSVNNSNYGSSDDIL